MRTAALYASSRTFFLLALFVGLVGPVISAVSDFFSDITRPALAQTSSTESLDSLSSVLRDSSKWRASLWNFHSF